MSAESSSSALAGVVAASAGSASKRFRHFWEGPNATAEQGAEEEMLQGSPVAQLYQHALESVFGLLSLADLSRAMSVSRSWSHAIRVMPCRRQHMVCPAKSLVSACSSVLSTHINSLHLFASDQCQVPSEALYILALRMPQLTALDSTITQAAATNVTLPHKLKTLKLNLNRITAAAAINTIIDGISQLTGLTTLELTLPSFLPAINFAPLTAVAPLRELQLSSAVNGSQPTELQLDQLRSLAALRLMSMEGLPNASLALLLRTPHELQWQEIHAVWDVDAVASAAFSSLPSLTTLRTRLCTHIGFLTHLVQLRTLDLHMKHNPWPATITAEAVVDGLSCCTQLTDLALTAPLNSKHLSVVLPRLPLLTKLWFWWMNELGSLECLRASPIVHTLRSLRINHCLRLEPSELVHVHALTRLEDLTIEQSFTEPLSKLDLRLHTPPSKLMPQLTRFTYAKPA